MQCIISGCDPVYCALVAPQKEVMRDINLKRTCYSAWPLFVLLGFICLASHSRAESLHQMDFTGGRDVEQNVTGSRKIELPVLTQPGLGVTTTTVTTITQTGGDWNTGLFDVCGDISTFLMGMFVPCCLDLSLAHQYGECMCLPVLPGSTFAMRVGIRERFKIRGSVCEDWTTVYCCYPLALCQMIREMKKRLKTQTYTVSTMLDSS